MRVMFLMLPLLLAGCASGGPGSVRGGECRVFERPEFVVLGKRRYDQNWIDSNIEGGVGACGWQRPKPRPPILDRPIRRVTVKSAPPPPKRWWQRRRDVVGSVLPLPRPPEAPQAPQIQPQPLPAVLAVPIDIGQPLRRLDPVDELLQARPRRQ